MPERLNMTKAEMLKIEQNVKIAVLSLSDKIGNVIDILDGDQKLSRTMKLNIWSELIDIKNDLVLYANELKVEIDRGERQRKRHNEGWRDCTVIDIY